MNKKAIALLSGGLDSILAAKVMSEQGVEVEGIHFVTSFGGSNSAVNRSELERAADKIGIKLTVKDISKEFLEVVQKPRHGYGRGANPCIDCKIFMLKKAKEYMQQTGAAFVVTGEVVGQRPMSQMKDTLNIIEKEAGLKGLLLRPLSAKLLNPTIAEEEGIVDRERLLSISGRSRKEQFSLAEKFGILEYQQPAGGCLLTDPEFAKKAKDLLEHNNFSLDDIQLLKIGRHFRISENCKLVIGRNEKENDAISNLAKEGDLLMGARDLPGPVGLLRGPATKDDVDSSLGIVARYTDKTDAEAITMEYWNANSEDKSLVKIEPLEKKKLEGIRI